MGATVCFTPVQLPGDTTRGLFNRLRFSCDGSLPLLSITPRERKTHEEKELKGRRVRLASWSRARGF